MVKRLSSKASQPSSDLQLNGIFVASERVVWQNAKSYPTSKSLAQSRLLYMLWFNALSMYICLNW